MPVDFYPRPPWGGRPGIYSNSYKFTPDFYPRPPWGGRRRRHCLHRHPAPISIHALRGEGDERQRRAKTGWGISIHALRGEGDQRCGDPVGQRRISIHALRGEGDGSWASCATSSIISIHALRGEGDDFSCKIHHIHHKFLSTPSVGRATAWPGKSGTAR